MSHPSETWLAEGFCSVYRSPAAGGHVQLLVSGSAGSVRILRHVRVWRAELSTCREEEVDAVSTATRVRSGEDAGQTQVIKTSPRSDLCWTDSDPVLTMSLVSTRPEDCQLSFLPAKKSNYSLFGCRWEKHDVTSTRVKEQTIFVWACPSWDEDF